MKIDSVRIVPQFQRFLVVVITKSGRIYHGNWADEPTKEEVLSAWKENRRSFTHIN